MPVEEEDGGGSKYENGIDPLLVCSPYKHDAASNFKTELLVR